MNPDLQQAIEDANEACNRAKKGFVTDALESLKGLLAKFPEMVGVRRNYATLLNKVGRSQDALEELKICLNMQPDFAEAWDSVGTTLLQTIRPEAAFDAYSKAINLAPSLLDVHSNRFLSTLYRCNQNAKIEQSSNDWKGAMQKLVPRNTEIGRTANSERLKIAFLSPDFRLHSVAFFLLPVLEEWKKFPVELHLYSDVEKPDAITSKFQSATDHFHDVQRLTDEDLTERIREDDIDVLFDLCGHFDSNRQAVFTRRAAPIQIAWLGYPSSTFTPNIDYRLTDTIIHGSGFSGEEQPITLSTGIHCYQPLCETPRIGPPPVQRSGQFTFGCFNNALKISPQIARLWGIILEQTPNSRLLLKAQAFSNPQVKEAVCQWISPTREIHERVNFLERTPSLTSHFDCYNQVDLALDTFPYNGTTTTCEGLWMGVPTLTLRGPYEQSRVGASLLQQIGLSSFAVDKAEAYIGLACALSKNPTALRQYRSSLRTHLSKSNLMQAGTFVKELDGKLRSILA